jgi:hypothetical protein
MAHKSKKKHIKHARQHELEHQLEMQPEKSAARPRRAAAPAATTKESKRAKRPGLVRKLAGAAASKLVARPKRIIQKARARVRKLID